MTDKAQGSVKSEESASKQWARSGHAAKFPKKGAAAGFGIVLLLANRKRDNPCAVSAKPLSPLVT